MSSNDVPPVSTVPSSAFPPPATRPVRLLRRDPDRVLGGVAGGIARFLDAPVWLVRVLFVLAVVVAGWGVGLYVVLWLVVPEAGRDHGVLDRWLHRDR